VTSCPSACTLDDDCGIGISGDRRRLANTKGRQFVGNPSGMQMGHRGIADVQMGVRIVIVHGLFKIVTPVMDFWMPVSKD
jgi:hypothetical protein